MFDVWKNTLGEIEQSISREQFSTWFTGTELLSVTGGNVIIGVPNVFKVKQLRVKFDKVIQAALVSSGVEVKTLDFKVLASERPKGRYSDDTLRPALATISNGLKPATASGALQTGLNARYTMDNFVIGTNNDLAVSVAQRIIDSPGTNYNPFFLYGGAGLGKTHLVQAMGNALLQKNPQLKILYIPISGFYSDFIKSLQSKKTDAFREKYRRLDVLIIDDFQFIMNKDASQQEFFDIFNELTQHDKQIIVTSDRLPEEIKSVDVRLSSRLSQSGAYDLQMPQFEDRCAILRSKAEYKGAEIEDEAIEYIADNIKTNIRALEGELDHILAVADLKGMTPLEVINEGYVSTPKATRARSVSPKQIVEQVAKHYQLTTKELCSKNRTSHIKTARQVAMYILSKELNMSTPKIALEVGVKDHTTVMHGIKKIEGDLKLDFILREQISTIKEKIYG